MLSNLQREYKQNIYFKFRELYQDYRISDHCRASNKITYNIENYFKLWLAQITKLIYKIW